jgi:hypothetical protein
VSRPERLVWLRTRGESVVASARPSPVGPLRSRRTAQLAARALLPDELERPGAALPRLRRRLRELSEARRFEDAGRLRDRMAALERVCRELKRLDRVRRLGCCVLVPAEDPGYVRAFFVAGGRVAAERTLPPGGGAALEIEAGLAAARRPGELDLDELLLFDSFLRRPPPELRVAPLEREAILGAARRLTSWHRDTSSSQSSETPSPQFTLPTG